MCRRSPAFHSFPITVPTAIISSPFITLILFTLCLQVLSSVRICSSVPCRFLSPQSNTLSCLHQSSSKQWISFPLPLIYTTERLKSPDCLISINNIIVRFFIFALCINYLWLFSNFVDKAILRYEPTWFFQQSGISAFFQRKQPGSSCPVCISVFPVLFPWLCKAFYVPVQMQLWPACGNLRRGRQLFSGVRFLCPWTIPIAGFMPK